jgi:hypothetical protein
VVVGLLAGVLVGAAVGVIERVGCGVLVGVEVIGLVELGVEDGVLVNPGLTLGVLETL